MERKKKEHSIPVAGYVKLPRLIELNRDAIRAYSKTEKKEACKSLVREILRWSTYTLEEAIGVLEQEQFHLVSEAEDYREMRNKKMK